MHVSAEVQEAFEVARAARLRAHAPYSKYQVGAALRVAGHAAPIAGCNVENASYGATVCAERTAVQATVARLGKFKPEFIVVVVDEERAAPPCALCLQVLAEFAGDDLPVYLGNLDGIQRRHSLGELLPHAFRVFRVPDQR